MKVTRSIVDALAINLSPQEAERLTRRTTNSLVAYDQFQEGSAFPRSARGKPISRRRRHIERRSRRTRAMAVPMVPLGYSLPITIAAAGRTPRHKTIDLALELAQKAVELDNSIPQTHWSLGYMHLMRKEYDTAESAVASAVAIAPNYADGYGLLALIKNALGEPESAITLIKRHATQPYYTWDYPTTWAGPTTRLVALKRPSRRWKMRGAAIRMRCL